MNDYQPYIPPPNYNTPHLSPEEERKAAQNFTVLLFFIGTIMLFFSLPVAFILFFSAALIRFFSQ